MGAAKWGLAAGLVLVGSLGCMGTKARERSEPVAVRPAAQTEGRMGMLCPAALPGVGMTLAEAPSGAAIVFAAPPERAAEVRERVRRVAAMHEQQPVGGGMRHGAGASTWHDATVSVEESQDGARLVFSARDPADVQALRDEVRASVERMQAGACHGPGGAPEENGGAPPH